MVTGVFQLILGVMCFVLGVLERISASEPLVDKIPHYTITSFLALGAWMGSWVSIYNVGRTLRKLFLEIRGANDPYLPTKLNTQLNYEGHTA